MRALPQAGPMNLLLGAAEADAAQLGAALDWTLAQEVDCYVPFRETYVRPNWTVQPAAA